MKKIKLVGILAAAVMLIFVAVTAYLHEKNADKSEEIFVIPVNNDELFVSSEEKYNSIKVYKQTNMLVINAQSETAFFDGAQFTVETDGKITPEDIEITWMTIGGNTEQAEDNDRIIAEIKISDNDELICDKKINFAKKAFDAVEDVLEMTHPRNNTSESIQEGCTSEVQEYTNEEIKKLFFGEWKVSKLLGFSEVQNDYSNYPDGHDIIGNHILINENAFSSEGLANYERYQCKVSNPTYEVSDIKYDYPIYYVNESVKEDTELYNMIMNEEFQELEIKGKGNCPQAVQIMISADNQLVILTMDGAYYLLEKIQ